MSKWNILYFSLQLKLQKSLKLLEDYKNCTLHPDVTDQDLWEAQKLKQVLKQHNIQNLSLLLLKMFTLKLKLKIEKVIYTNEWIILCEP